MAVYEVKSLLLEETYTEDMIMQTIRRSVRGEASRLLMGLGTGVDIETILEKFESVYGTVETKEELLANFIVQNKANQMILQLGHIHLKIYCQELLSKE